MNKMNNGTRRVEDIINSFNQFEELDAKKYYCNEETINDNDEAENYEDYYIEEDITLEDLNEDILSITSYDESEETPYYTEETCDNLNASNISQYNEDNPSNYYTESASDCGEEVKYDCSECFSDGIEEGYSEGYEEGVAMGRNSQCRKSYERGFCDGRKKGFEEGYEKAKQEVIDYINERNRNRNRNKNSCCKRCKCRCNINNCGCIW